MRIARVVVVVVALAGCPSVFAQEKAQVRLLLTRDVPAWLARQKRIGKTGPVAGMALAVGLARLGDADAARRELAEEAAELKGDPVLAWLAGAYRQRLEEAAAGKPSGPWSAGLRTRLAALRRANAYAFYTLDRIRQYGPLLESHTHFDPFARFRGQRTPLEMLDAAGLRTAALAAKGALLAEALDLVERLPAADAARVIAAARGALTASAPVRAAWLRLAARRATVDPAPALAALSATAVEDWPSESVFQLAAARPKAKGLREALGRVPRVTDETDSRQFRSMQFVASAWHALGEHARAAAIERRTLASLATAGHASRVLGPYCRGCAYREGTVGLLRAALRDREIADSFSTARYLSVTQLRVVEAIVLGATTRR